MIDLPQERSSVERRYWLFHFTVAEVLEALERRVAGHRARIEYWTAEFEQANSELREKGITYEPDLGGTYTGTRIAGDATRYKVEVDPELKRRVDVALSAIDSHKHEIKQCLPYLAALRAELDKERKVPLTADDVEFFKIGPEFADTNNS